MNDLMNPLAADQRIVAERTWQGRTLAPKPQKPCDIALFSDESAQIDLIEMLQGDYNLDKADD